MKITEILKSNTGKENKEVTLVTHKGPFHADETAATAILKRLFEEENYKVNIIRTFDITEYINKPNHIIYDIGNGEYDHHQIDDKHCLREDNDGVTRKYSSVGLIWREIGHYFVSEKYTDEVYDNFIKYIDDTDNGFGPNPLSYVISAMNNVNIPIQMMSEEAINTSGFYQAVGVMTELFLYIISSIHKKENEEKEIKVAINEYYNNGTCYVATEKYFSGMVSACTRENIPFYIYPNVRGGYCFRTIPVAGGKDMNDHIIDIPQSVRDWEGVTFLHPSAFLGSAETKERAIEIVEKIASGN